MIQSFWLLCNILFCEYALSDFIPSSAMGIWIVAKFLLLHIKLIWVFLLKQLTWRIWVLQSLTINQSSHMVSQNGCCCLVAKSCLTLCNPMDCSLPGSYVHGILQARVLEWVSISSSWGSSQLKDQIHVSCGSPLAGRFFTTELPGKPNHKTVNVINLAVPTAWIMFPTQGPRVCFLERDL